MHYKKCVICGIRSGRSNGQKRIFMAKFPLNEDRCKQWVKVTGIEDLVYVPIEKLHQLKNVCGNHFRLKDFKKKKTQLRKNAIPSIGLTAEPLAEELFIGFPLHIAQTEEIEAESNIPEKDKGFSWLTNNKTLDLRQDEPEHSDVVPHNKPLYCNDDTASVTVTENNGVNRHEGYHCDSCNGDIIGYRYTCVQCNNFDICVACETSGAHAHHYMLRIPGPRPYKEIQTVLVTIRKYLSRELNPIATTDLDKEDAISLKSEIKSEILDEDIIEPVQRLDTSDEDTMNDDFRQHYRLSSHDFIDMNPDSNEASEKNRAVQRQMTVLNAEKAITQRILTKSENVRLKILNANDINRNPVSMTKEKQSAKITIPSIGKRKIVIKRSDLESEQTYQIAKKIRVLPSTSTQEMKKTATILPSKSNTLNPRVKLLDVPLSTILKQRKIASSQVLCLRQNPKTISVDKKS